MDRTLIGLTVFFALGIVWAIVSDLRRNRRRRRYQVAQRQRRWQQLRERGYDVVPIAAVGEYGPLILDTPWNRILAEEERWDPERAGRVTA